MSQTRVIFLAKLLWRIVSGSFFKIASWRISTCTLQISVFLQPVHYFQRTDHVLNLLFIHVLTLIFFFFYSYVYLIFWRCVFVTSSECLLWLFGRNSLGLPRSSSPFRYWFVTSRQLLLLTVVFEREVLCKTDFTELLPLLTPFFCIACHFVC